MLRLMADTFRTALRQERYPDLNDKRSSLPHLDRRAERRRLMRLVDSEGRQPPFL
ncbi:hypothetical protein AADZ90_004325 [Aestuariibius sp. 2305UL40-4]|uniref:hypothetical protein n=1 Tax=Aestuariibius violaceus TaxID=3234132 RepID=UPI00345E4F26